MTESNGDAATRDSRPSSRQSYPEDRFDLIPRSGRVGAHRLAPRPRYFWKFLFAGVLGFLLLTTLGVIAVHSLGGSSLPIGPSPTSDTPAPTRVQAELDPTATIALLDGTTDPNLGSNVDKIITGEGWGQIVFSGKAASTDVAISAIFYGDEADEAAALGLAEQLGGVSVYPTDDYAQYKVRLVVLLGADYAGPGLEGASLQTEPTTPAQVEPQVDPETGFAIDPETGYLVDPESGWLIDPESGWLIDPSTGYLVNRETGEVVDPATGMVVP